VFEVSESTVRKGVFELEEGQDSFAVYGAKREGERGVIAEPTGEGS
jgi:hypothetical protein